MNAVIPVSGIFVILVAMSGIRVMKPYERIVIRRRGKRRRVRQGRPFGPFGRLTYVLPGFDHPVHFDMRQIRINVPLDPEGGPAGESGMVKAAIRINDPVAALEADNFLEAAAQATREELAVVMAIPPVPGDGGRAGYALNGASGKGAVHAEREREVARRLEPRLAAMGLWLDWLTLIDGAPPKEPANPSATVLPVQLGNAESRRTSHGGNGGTK